MRELVHSQTPQNHKIDESLDIREILPAVKPALEKQNSSRT